MCYKIRSSDVPAAAADYFNTSGQLYHCTRNYRRVGLSGMRLLSTSPDEEGRVTKQSVLDQFLSESHRKENPSIALWDWAKKCNCTGKSKCNIDHVPIFTGLNTKPVWPVIKDYAKYLLMVFVPGTWNSIDELKDPHETLAEALAEFLESPSCPTMVHDSLKEAKRYYEKKRPQQNQSGNGNSNRQNAGSNQNSQFIKKD